MSYETLNDKLSVMPFESMICEKYLRSLYNQSNRIHHECFGRHTNYLQNNILHKVPLGMIHSLMDNWDLYNK